MVAREGRIAGEGRLALEVEVGPARLRWVEEHLAHPEGRGWVSRQLRGPFTAWEHLRRCTPDGPEASVLEDRIDYRLPLGAAGEILGGRLAGRELERILRHQHRTLVLDLERHGRVRDRGRQRIVISGASGLVGCTLAAFLSSGGHQVLRLVRGPASPGEIRWDPGGGPLDSTPLEGVDAVVHLAGASISEGRWNVERKRLILESRVRGTRVLCEALARTRASPRVLISASAIGYYGDRGAAWLDEQSAPGRGFLAEVCRHWETATQPARDRGIRVVPLRIGVVLTARGGALARMLPPFRMGLGGVVGSGDQYLSWIALEDLVGAIQHLLFADPVDGPVNAVAPGPVTQRKLARVLGAVLRRPAVLPLPAPVVRAALGELGQALLLEGARVSCARLQRSGFTFRFPDLGAALRAELGRGRP